MEIAKNEILNIESKIYIVRGKEVMLDSDLAELYECSNGTKSINLAVNRHPNRFPEKFMFQLTKEECTYILRFQNETANISSKSRSLPYAFTEQGVAMLASVLKTKVAEEISIRIMDAFVKMRKYISGSLLNNEMLINHENRILRLENTFNKLEEKQKVNTIFFEGQIYDAYSLLIDILNKAKKEIIIIDNYAGKELLDILKDINKKITIVSSNINESLKKKYEKQYSNITFINNNTFHDRFIIIDNNKLYTCGASFKDLGKKCFAINEMNSQKLIEDIMKTIS